MRRVLAFAVALATLSTPLPAAFSLTAPYFEREASGNAAYEAMVIHPEAVFDAAAEKTYVAYQGFGLDPYVAAYDHEDQAWEGPFRVGDNPLIQDFHGGPSIALDAEGYVHVFYGAHNSNIKHVRSLEPNTVSQGWTAAVDVATGTTKRQGTYPQPLLVGDKLMLFYRVRTSNKAYDGAWAVLERAGDGGWTGPRYVIEVRPGMDAWYANFSLGPDGRTVHCAFHWRDIGSPDMSTRYDLYYMRRDPDGRWVDLEGQELPREGLKKTYPDGTPGLDERCKVWDSQGAGVNQMVVRADDEGAPHILFLAERPLPGGDRYDWRYIEGRTIEGTSSVETTFPAEPERITGTDDFFDAGDLDVSGGRTVAYLTTGGVPDPQALPGATNAARGGDIEEWELGAGGEWSLKGPVKRSPDASSRYNDPQIVRTAGGGPPHPDARLMFAEWNNDGANFIHKVFLWGESGFLGREFTPDAWRLAGPNRVETAVAVSRRAFPNGSQTYEAGKRTSAVFVASKSDFPDVLCGGPLAHAYQAPLLLVSKDRLDASVSAEIDRLFSRAGSPEATQSIARKVFILGGEAAVSRKVEDALRAKSKVSVERIAGPDRYATSRSIASKLKARRGGERPTRVVIASGVTFPDALVVSPLAARKAWPILLTRQDSLPSASRDAIAALKPAGSLVVGSEAAVSSAVAGQVANLTGSAPLRKGGPTRYDTALEIARYAQSERVLESERFVLASGEDFPDGLAGGVMAARFRATMLITSRDLNPRFGTLPASTERWVADNAHEVLDVFVLGGEPAVSAQVMNRLMSLLPAPPAPQ